MSVSEGQPVLTPELEAAASALLGRMLNPNISVDEWNRLDGELSDLIGPEEIAALLSELAREREAGEELAAEVLAARVRLGEAAWTFKDQNADALQGLAAKGLVWVKAGVVEGTLLSGFTDEGRAAYLSEKYEPPVEGRVRKLQEALELLATMNWTGVAEAEEASDWVRKVASEALVGLPEGQA